LTPARNCLQFTAGRASLLTGQFPPGGAHHHGLDSVTRRHPSRDPDHGGARPLPSLSFGFALLVRVAATKGVSGPGFRSAMPALGMRPHICGGSTRRGRAPLEDPPRGSRGSLEPATSLMTGGAALSVSAGTARGGHERLARGALLSALRSVYARWKLGGPRRRECCLGRKGKSISPKCIVFFSFFYFFFPFHDLFFLSI
jgi:hypothetical protein